jgi:hypothetical protein
MKSKKLTPIKAIRKKCLDCCAGQVSEIRRCTIPDCPLFGYRFGKNPARQGLGNRENLLSGKF